VLACEAGASPLLERRVRGVNFWGSNGFRPMRSTAIRKRLEEKCPDVQIRPVRRSRFELQIGCGVQLRESDSA